MGNISYLHTQESVWCIFSTFLHRVSGLFFWKSFWWYTGEYLLSWLLRRYVVSIWDRWLWWTQDPCVTPLAAVTYFPGYNFVGDSSFLCVVPCTFPHLRKAATFLSTVVMRRGHSGDFAWWGFRRVWYRQQTSKSLPVLYPVDHSHTGWRVGVQGLILVVLHSLRLMVL